MKTIDFAIDLGTTNSLIAKCQNGKVKVYKNPRGFKETLPSVVGYRKSGVIIGDKAKELKNSDYKNVFSSFKRKIGTDASYYVENKDCFVKPQDLSSLVLKELQTFVIDQTVKSCVITIPASFSTVQSNATKEAGYSAGFEEIVLLQEPIAASLAVFNGPNNDKKSGNWLVFDLGGGTFDVAIVEISDNDLKIVDHEGNNFLGGLDFDTAIVKEVIIPKLADTPELAKLADALKSAESNADSSKLFELLLVYAEQLKVELSSFEKAFIEIPLQDENKETHYVDVELTVERFNEIIEPFVSNTIGLVRDLLSRNNMSASSLEEVVMVGGSTYIPYVRECIVKEFNVAINQEVDPSTAIVEGAAYYAGNKESKLKESEALVPIDKNVPALDMFYEKNDREDSSLLLVNASNFINGDTVRILRSDKGFDSGYVELKSKLHVPLSLLSGVLNEFSVEVYRNNTLIEHAYSTIAIRQGHYSIDGQPIPSDICLEVDDIERGETILEPIFYKNDILPLVKTIYKTVSRDILSTSDETISINILEGDRNASPATNLLMGQILISPKELGQNLYKGTDLGVVIEINESRDLQISLNVMSMDSEITESFKPNQRTVDERKIRSELGRMSSVVDRELEQYVVVEDFEAAAEMRTLSSEFKNCLTQLGTGNVSDDTLFSVDEQKRKLGARYDRLLRNKEILKDVEELRDSIQYGEQISREPDISPGVKKNIEDQVKIGGNALKKSNIKMIRQTIKRLDEFIWEYKRNNTNHLRGIFFQYSMYPISHYKDQEHAQTLIDKGEKISGQDSTSSLEWIHLINALYHNLCSEFKQSSPSPEDFSGTGLE